MRRRSYYRPVLYLPVQLGASQVELHGMAMASSLTTLLAFGTLFSVAYGHGHLFDPLPRGLLAGSEFIEYPVFDPRAPRDYIPHFPAGDKNPEPGSGLRSQMAAGKLWTPYEPWRPFFRFRAGPCGDTINGNEHMRGGKYYYGGKITKTYVQGGILSASVVLAQHHNGFFEFTLCDVTKCGGEISYKCLRNQRTCRKLRRVKDPRCETRWYVDSIVVAIIVACVDHSFVSILGINSAHRSTLSIPHVGTFPVRRTALTFSVKA